LVNKYKNKGLTIHRKRLRGIQLRSKLPMFDCDEQCSLSHVLQEANRGKRKLMTKFRDENDRLCEGTLDIQKVCY